MPPLKSINLIASTFVATAVAGRSKGCGLGLPPAQSPPEGDGHPTDFTQSDGTKRQYLIHIPSNYDKDAPSPFIFSFHGRTKTASEQKGLSQFSDEKWNPDAIAVYPQGLGVSDNSF
jgi:poly(3-hydroxybutyrate) depolymerase